MPYQREETTFSNLLKQALKKPEIVQGIKRTDISQKLLEETIQKKKQIWDVVAKEIEALEEIEAQIKNYELELLKLYPDHYAMEYIPKIKKEIKNAKNELTLTIKQDALLKLYSAYSDRHPLLRYLLFFSPYIFNFIRWRETAKYKQKKRDIGINILEEEFAKVTALIEQTVLEQGILPELRLAIGTYLTPSYETLLPAISAPGLAEVFDPTYEIPTKPKNELRRQIENMPAGSIGIAGPRGAGKTTLLQSLCQSSEKLKGRSPISVLIPAPVEYNARDFVLHIFSMVCLRVLKLEGERVEDRTPWIPLNEMQQSSVENNPVTHLLHFIGAKSINTFVLNSVIVSCILIAGSIKMLYPPISGTIPQLPQTSPDKTMTFFISIINIIIIYIVFIINIIIIYFKAIEIKPSTLFSWGLFFAICGLAGRFINRRLLEDNRKKEEEKHLRQLEEEQMKEKREKNALVKQTWKWLDIIKFQQSYSSGWSGSLQLPLGLAGSVNSVVSLAQNQLSLPEIIEGYRQFIAEVTTKYLVVIGIDEMDKLESDEKAERFLNEIKVLFGIPYCFYLISISESAMSHFERRGLPFRDTFDSSFDSIIYVDYLDCQNADSLLKRRVIGLPIPFVCLCYCLSGGLARDLIRRCRDLLAATPTGNTLAVLCNHLISAEIQVILRASTISAKKNLPETVMNQFLEMMNQLESELLESSLSLKSVTRVAQWMKQDIHNQETNVSHEQIQMQKAELVTYLYYVVTLMEYFTDKTDVAWKQAWSSSTTRPNDFDQLARIRQYFSISFHVACIKISHFRSKHGMDTLELQESRSVAR